MLKIDDFKKQGFAIVEDVYSHEEIDTIASTITKSSSDDENVLSSNDLFAIRRFLSVVPKIKEVLFTDGLKKLLKSVASEDYFLTKAIYFDKPKVSNWFVSYHQDLSISVKNKAEVQGYNRWTKKGKQIGVIPPTEILENIITLRIHLDKTDETNGALKVLPKSHLKGIVRKENLNYEQEVICNVKRGGVMLMKPLLMHASGKSRSNLNRRVIHLEFSNKELKAPIEWLERQAIFAKA